MVWRDLHVIAGMVDGHCGMTLEQLGHHVLPVGVDVLKHDKRHSAIGRHIFHKGRQGFQTAG